MSWPQVAIGTLGQIYDGPHATPKPSNEGPIFLGIKNITEDGRLDLSEIRHIAEDDYPRWIRRVEPKPGDIVFIYEAGLNRYAVIPEGFRGCLGRRTALIRLDRHKADARFILYYFLGEEWRHAIARNVWSGATVDRIPLTNFPTFPVSLPPLPTQRKIATILSAYDDLIENNTRRIAILEKMARLLYHEWFVDFRFPGHQSVQMVDSPLGVIPKGWEPSKLGAVADTNAATLRPASAPDVINYVDIKSVSPGRIDNVEPMLFKEAPGRARRSVAHGDIIWSSVRPNRRSYSLVLSPEQNLVVSTGFTVITARDVPYSYLYHAITTDEFVGYIVGRTTGAAYPAVTAADFESANLLLPLADILESFHDTVADMLNLCDRLRRQNSSLRKTRDLLLPRLISGEIDLEDLEINTEGLAA